MMRHALEMYNAFYVKKTDNLGNLEALEILYILIRHVTISFSSSFSLFCRIFTGMVSVGFLGFGTRTGTGTGNTGLGITLLIDTRGQRGAVGVF